MLHKSVRYFLAKKMKNNELSTLYCFGWGYTTARKDKEIGLQTIDYLLLVRRLRHKMLVFGETRHKKGHQKKINETPLFLLVNY